MILFLKKFLSILSKSPVCCSWNYLKFRANMPNILLWTLSSTMLFSGVASSLSSIARNNFSIFTLTSCFAVDFGGC